MRSAAVFEAATDHEPPPKREVLQPRGQIFFPEGALGFLFGVLGLGFVDGRVSWMDDKYFFLWTDDFFPAIATRTEDFPPSL